MRIFNNTIMDNITTATAVTSNGLAALRPGLSTSENSQQLQATLGGGAPSFSNPLLFNNMLLGQPGRHPGRNHGDRRRSRPATRPRSTTGTSGWPTAPACCAP